MVESTIPIKKLARQCRFGTCITRATFCYQSAPKEVYCKEHKQTDMISLQSNKCKYETCQKQGTFKDCQMSKVYWCQDHKPEITIRVKNNTCTQEGCTIRASFGIDEKPIRCLSHKSTEMRDVINPKCTREGCNTRKYKNDSLCMYHINEPTLFDQIKSILITALVDKFESEYIRPEKNKKLCAYTDCTIRGTFGLPNQQKPKIRYCTEHKTPGMVDLDHIQCQFEDCNSRAGFNYESERHSEYCVDHKYPGMIPIERQQCKALDCTTKPSFGFIGERTRLYCAKHKTEGMIGMDGQKCRQQDCLIRANFNIPGHKQPLYCYHHKNQGMINIYAVQCQSCEITARYEGLCSKCYYYKYPDNFQTRQYKIKERAVVEYLRQSGLEYLVNDKIIPGGVGNYRPDILIPCSTHNIIVEINEYQHKVYDKIQERVRTLQLFKDLKERSLVIIRFNPDGYFKDGVRYGSPWSYRDRNTLIMENGVEWLMRLQILKKSIQDRLVQLPDKQILEIQLFMDE